MHIYSEEESKARMEGITRFLESQEANSTANQSPTEYAEQSGVDLLTHLVQYIETHDTDELLHIQAIVEELTEHERQAIGKVYRKLFLGGSK